MGVVLERIHHQLLILTSLVRMSIKVLKHLIILSGSNCVLLWPNASNIIGSVITGTGSMTLPELCECIVKYQPSASSVPFFLHLARDHIIQKYSFGIDVSEPLAVESSWFFKVCSIGPIHSVILNQCSGIAYVLYARAAVDSSVLRQETSDVIFVLCDLLYGSFMF